MSLRVRPAALLALSALASSMPLLHAQDVRVTCSGTVASIGAGGVGTPPFAGVTVGDAVTLVVDVQVANQLPFGRALGLLNWPTSDLTIGAATDGLAPQPNFQQVNLGNDVVEYGDFVGFQSFLTSDGTTQMQLFLSNPLGTSWSSDQWEDLIGTTVQAAGLVSVFQIWSPQGAVNFDLASVQFDAAPGGPLGATFCSAAPNSTGAVGLVSANGLASPGSNDLTLVASELPLQTIGYFLTSLDQGFVANPGGSEGNLCLSGSIGRFVGAGEVKSTDFGGEIALPIDLGDLPTPTGSTVVQAGQTWNFQLWHRDVGLAGPTSNFTAGLAVAFQ